MIKSVVIPVISCIQGNIVCYGFLLIIVTVLLNFFILDNRQVSAFFLRLVNTAGEP